MGCSWPDVLQSIADLKVEKLEGGRPWGGVGEATLTYCVVVVSVRSVRILKFMLKKTGGLSSVI